MTECETCGYSPGEGGGFEMYDNQADNLVIAVKYIREPKPPQSVQTHYYAYEPGLSGQRKNTS